MARTPTKIKVLTGYTQDPRPQDGYSYDDAVFARGGVIPLGFVPQVKADLNQPAGVLDAEYAVIETAATPTDIPIDHNLRRVPRRFAVVNKSATVDIWSSPTAWTDSRIFLRASAGGVRATIEIA